jgi:purine-binding chemotaxis protein CheW
MGKRQMVTFKCGEEEYAIDIQLVKEIIRPPAFTRVPKSPEYIKGVINLRGNIVPVISLSKRLGNIESDLTEQSRIVILTIDDISFGIIVDSVTEVNYLEEKDIETPELITTVDAKFVNGVGKIDDRLLILLNLSEIIDNQQATNL